MFITVKIWVARDCKKLYVRKFNWIFRDRLLKIKKLRLERIIKNKSDGLKLINTTHPLTFGKITFKLTTNLTSATIKTMQSIAN